MVERGSSEEDSRGSWHKEVRELTYTKVMEDIYLKYAPEDDPGMREKLEKFIKTGRVFDLSKEFMLHLLNSDNEQGS